ncbi:hypothetical protein GQ53DRAFT_28093 [Thozetella sp. PMI_491]|nr:hypothetical protein GQ53DRAFT_28093 [Thozetella sp. PMI_491]
MRYSAGRLPWLPNVWQIPAHLPLPIDAKHAVTPSCWRWGVTPAAVCFQQICRSLSPTRMGTQGCSMSPVPNCISTYTARHIRAVCSIAPAHMHRRAQEGGAREKGPGGGGA